MQHISPVFYCMHTGERQSWRAGADCKSVVVWLNGFESHFPYFLAAWSKGYDAWFSARKLQVQVLSRSVWRHSLMVRTRDFQSRDTSSILVGVISPVPIAKRSRRRTATPKVCVRITLGTYICAASIFHVGCIILYEYIV